MPRVDPAFPVKRPISVWNRPLKADFKGIFGALGRGALHGFTGQWTELGSDAVDAVAGLGIDTRDAPQLGWVLIRRSLQAAMAELAREAAPLAGEPSKEALDHLPDQLDAQIEKEKVAIDRKFFECPRELPLLVTLERPFSEWLVAYGLQLPAAVSIARRLPSYFVAALHAEWRRSPGTYGPVQEAVATPFTRAAERERAWALYTALLDRQVDEPMFGEAFGLRQVYVPLRAFYVIEAPRDRTAGFTVERERALEGPEEHRVAVELEASLDAWLESTDRHDGYRVISGGPGCGKSSFARMYAAQVARECRIPVLFVPLHQLNVSGALVDAIGEYVRLADLLPVNPLDPEAGEDRLLVIFDGLDELSLQGRVGADAARDFVREVLKVVAIRNHTERRLLVLFSGREPVIQASESEFRHRQRILHVLPYLVDEHFRGLKWQSGRELLGEDSRQTWWRLYGKASGLGYTGLPRELRRTDLDEVTAQPLLNYLVALGHSRGRRFSEDLNLNDIYEDLLEAVHARGYEQKRPHAAIQGLSLPDFRRVLEEIALSAWHGNGRTTTVSEIEEHCLAAGLSTLLERFAEGAKTGVARVLTAFYFRQFGRTAGGDPTFEFTHKSFREYLTALRVVRALERIDDELDRRAKNLDSGWDEREALRHWIDIAGPSVMDRELWGYIQREVTRREVKTATRWQSMLCRLITAMLRNGMPMELLAPRPSYQEEARRGRNSEEALLAVLNACARFTQQVSVVEWPNVEGEGSKELVAGAWFKRLQGQRGGPDNVLALRSLSFLDLSKTALYMQDLYRADLHKSNLRRAGCYQANFAQANLENADLREGYLSHANLSKASLQGSNLRRATLDGADLRGANLREVNLTEAHLEGANLREADLRRALLKGAYLAGANLGRADLRGADLRGAHLHEANFQGANLQQASLEGADLEEATLKAAKLEGAELKTLLLEGGRQEGSKLEARTSKKQSRKRY